MHKLALLAVLPLTLSSCANPANSNQDLTDSLRATDAALTKAVTDRNLDQIIGFYADDAVLLPTAEPIVSGKAAIREEWHHILSIPNFQSKSATTRLEVAKGGDMAYSMGTYTAIMLGENGQSVTEPGKWVSIWKRQPDGSWRIAVETYNTDIPPPDHK